MYKQLDPLLHSQLRLAIMSLLLGVDRAEFTYIQEKTGATAGNLSIQLGKLRDAGYLTMTKSFRDNYPLTTCKATVKGIAAFDEYAKALQSYIKPK